MKKTVIEFNNFSYQYRVQHEPTLKNINLSIKEGEKVLILGPSGSGKSTLGACLNGIIPFRTEGLITGSLKINEKETSSLSLFELSQMVGTVLQDPDSQFIGLTVGEDMAFGLENQCIPQTEMKEQVREIASIVDASHFLEATPHSLSGGQKQRVTLGGTLVSNSNILLFDEPLASLDPATGEKAIDLIDHIHDSTSKTIIIIEHRLEDVLYRHVDRVIVMNEGCIILDTTPNELLKQDVLKQNGIREPLYITALKYAGYDLNVFDKVEALNDIKLEAYKQKLEAFIDKENAITKDIKENLDTDVLLEFKQVHFSYDKRKPLLQDINLKVYKGEMISIVGKNGAGKSTLSKLICGFYKPTKGQLLLKGQDMKHLSIKERCSSIGLVLQNPNQMLSKPMLYDEVALALRNQGVDESEVKERVYETLKICGLYQMRNWPISALSYGQKKRVTIASILVSKPEILILDEPTAGQDFKHYTEMMEFLKELNNQGITIIMITHDMHLMLEYTDRAIALANGKVLGDDTTINVLTTSTITKEAHLKETSLYSLAVKAKLEDPKAFVYSFIREDRRRRNQCQM